MISPEMRGEPVRKNCVFQVFDTVVAYSAAGHLGNGWGIFKDGPSSGERVDENFSPVRCQHV